MADKDVITALELCANISQDGCMMLCPYKDEQDETYSGLCEHLLKQDALELLKRQQAEIEQLKWNPISKKLPTEYGKYWVYTKAGKIFPTEFRPDEEYKEEPFYQWGWEEPEAPEGWVSFYFDDGEHDIDEITHWMYCFEPPKVGEQE